MKLFYYLPSIADRKEEVKQHKYNVSLSLVNCPLTFTESFSSKKVLLVKKFSSKKLLNSADPDQMNPQVEMLYGLFR